jgi:hypothetical protein
MKIVWPSRRMVHVCWRFVCSQWTPVFYEKITLLFLQQMTRFKWLWVHPDIRKNLSLDPITKKKPPMHLSSLMPYAFGYRHIYPDALLPRAVTYTYNLIHSTCLYSRDPIPTFLGPDPRREGVPRWPLSQVRDRINKAHGWPHSQNVGPDSALTTLSQAVGVMIWERGPWGFILHRKSKAKWSKDCLKTIAIGPPASKQASRPEPSELSEGN